MEIREYIREYLRTKRRWLLPLVAVPIVAGVSAAALIAVQPPESTARVQVRVPSSESNGDSQIGLYIARLSEGLTLPSVQRQIVADTRVPLAEMRSLAVERREQSDQFVVTLTTTAGDDRTLATAVNAAKVGSVWVAEQATGQIDAALKVAQTSFDEAQSALFAYQDEIDNLDPTVTYAAVSRSIVTPPPTVSVASLRAQQSELVGQVRRYTELRDAVARANGQLAAARTVSANQQALIATAESGQLILDSRVVARSTVQPIIEGAVMAAVFAFLLVLGLSMVPDLLRRQRTRTAEVGPKPGVEGTEPDAQAAADRREFDKPVAHPAEGGTSDSTSSEEPEPTSSGEPEEDRVPVHSSNSAGSV
ncbi:MAG: hypothetical protein L0K86_00165 [Actinomycetia bacterium]|nr:hypothetical protein [Actinomycetes bacterium]